MDRWIKLEEAAMFAFSVFLFYQTEWPWWYYPAMILLPDIGMVGYAINARVGALTYNVVHHRVLALALLAWGMYADWAVMELVGIILFGHIGMDRMIGYGLKYPSGFHDTHLGRIGRKV